MNGIYLAFILMIDRVGQYTEQFYFFFFRSIQKLHEKIYGEYFEYFTYFLIASRYFVCTFN